MINRARLRGELGNPPGKGGSIGDAVNWELLLEFRPPDHLFYVTDDRDFYSTLHEDRPLDFLTTEWERMVGQPIGFVRRLSELPDEVPAEVLPIEDVLDDERDELIGELEESWSFARTHALIAALSNFPRFSARQVSRLVAALGNDQVGWIAGDFDVYDFFTGLLRNHDDLLTEDDRARLQQTFPPRDPEPDFPF